MEPSLVSVGTAKMIHCRRRCWWWCVHDLRLKIIMHRCDVWTCMSAANACWIVLCKCMLDIKCSVLRGWSCAITKSFEFWLRTDEKMGLILKILTNNRGTQARFCQNGTTGENDVRSAVATQWPTSMRYEDALDLY